MKECVVENRYPLAGYVYSADGRDRLGFSPVTTVLRDGPMPEGIGENAIAYWQSNWGEPSKKNFPHMVAALKAEFPGRRVVPT